MKNNLTRREFLKRSSIATAGLYCSTAFGNNFLFFEDKKNLFSPGIGVCTSINNFDLVKKFGYNYIEESVNGFLIPNENNEKFDEKLLILKNSSLPILSCNGFIPGHLKIVGNESRHEEIIRFAETVFIRAHQAKIKFIVLGSGAARRIPEGFDRLQARNQFLSLIAKLAALAEKNDIVICIEQLNHNETNFLNTLAETNEIVKTANHSHIKLLADIYHMKVENDGPEEIIKAGNNLFHCHIAEKTDRTAPGINKENFKPYLESLKTINYKGNISMECSWKNFNDELPVAIEYLKNQIAEVNQKN